MCFHRRNGSDALTSRAPDLSPKHYIFPNYKSPFDISASPHLTSHPHSIHLPPPHRHRVTSGLSLLSLTVSTNEIYHRCLSVKHTYFSLSVSLLNHRMSPVCPSGCQTLKRYMNSCPPPEARGCKSERAANCLICCVRWPSLVCPGGDLTRTQTPALALCGPPAELNDITRRSINLGGATRSASRGARETC